MVFSKILKLHVEGQMGSLKPTETLEHWRNKISVSGLVVGVLLFLLLLGWEFLLMHEELSKPFGFTDILAIALGCAPLIVISFFLPMNISAGVLTLAGGFYWATILRILLPLPDVPMTVNRFIIAALLFLPGFAPIIVGCIPLRKSNSLDNALASTPETTIISQERLTRLGKVFLIMNLMVLLISFALVFYVIYYSFTGAPNNVQGISMIVVFIFASLSWNRFISIGNKFGYFQPPKYRLLCAILVSFMCIFLWRDVAKWGEISRVSNQLKPLLAHLNEQYKKTGTVPYFIGNPMDYMDSFDRRWIKYISDGTHFLIQTQGNADHWGQTLFLTYNSCTGKWIKRYRTDLICLSQQPPPLSPKYRQENLSTKLILDDPDHAIASQIERLNEKDGFNSRQSEYKKALKYLEEIRRIQ